MRILHVVPYLHPDAGGPPVVVDRLCRRLAGRGHEVRVITTDLFAKEVSAGSHGWEQVYADGGYTLEIHRASPGGGSFAYSRTLASAIQTAVAAADIVHLHTLWTYPTLRAAWACRQRGVPFVVMPHGMLDPNSVSRKRTKKWLYSRLIERPNLRHAAGMIFTHPEEERLARRSVAGLPRGWITPLAADEPPPLDRAELAREFLRKNPELVGGRIVLFLGRLHSKKGLDLLIPAFADVAKRFPDMRLVLVGPGEPDYIRELRDLAVRCGVVDGTHFLGPLSGRAKWAALAAATVFALPSHQENFAISAVEAMSVGTPVIISDRVNIWPEVQKNEAGLILIMDSENLSDKLFQVIGDSEFSARIGNNGRCLVRKAYNWDRTAEAVEDAYRDILTASAQRGIIGCSRSSSLQTHSGV